MLEFTKGKWLIHEGYFDGITLNPKQYYIYPDSGEPYTDNFIVCAEEADAKLAANAPAMYEFIHNIAYGDSTATDLQAVAMDLLTRIEDTEIHNALFEDD